MTEPESRERARAGDVSPQLSVRGRLRRATNAKHTEHPRANQSKSSAASNNSFSKTHSRCMSLSCASSVGVRAHLHTVRDCERRRNNKRRRAGKEIVCLSFWIIAFDSSMRFSSSPPLQRTRDSKHCRRQSMQIEPARLQRRTYSPRSEPTGHGNVRC